MHRLQGHIGTHVIVKIVKKDVSTFIISFLHYNICIDYKDTYIGIHVIEKNVST